MSFKKWQSQLLTTEGHLSWGAGVADGGPEGFLDSAFRHGTTRVKRRCPRNPDCFRTGRSDRQIRGALYAIN